jgi:hypothetical protein
MSLTRLILTAQVPHKLLYFKLIQLSSCLPLSRGRQLHNLIIENLEMIPVMGGELANTSKSLEN